MIPDFEAATGYLPEGEHVADWNEVCDRFAWNAHRVHLLSGLRRLTIALRDAGCGLFLLDGSFVTRKEFPGDFDACCDYSGMTAITLMRLRLMGSKEIMKAEYFGEVYAYAEPVPGDERYSFRMFFQRDVDDVPKGLVRLNLASVS
ncbi:hypothetical protein MKK68_10000 [Methylobacterium sp. E-016]|uniref:DUF6932 family protein n=1 Tax=Methylobacterium sp. E-016 TaxID=2836556 RepID=UPI001FBA2094|nr:hypothetical protein [Methylobacterium sp. E-016]MCJ2075986.1 hypothetical protein [Methylobacterium sp. E-016]